MSSWVVKLSLDTHFPNLKTPGKWKIIVSKPFVHAKFDKIIEKNTIDIFSGFQNDYTQFLLIRNSVKF